MCLVIMIFDDQVEGYLVEVGIDKVLIEEMGMFFNIEDLFVGVQFEVFLNFVKGVFMVSYEVL